jgi:hypothetical protein
MDSKIINDTFEKDPHICSFCECASGNHLVFFKCPLFSGNPICQDCCMIDMMKDNVDAKVAAKLGNPITKETINSICRSCGMNNACQNAELAKKLESGKTGDTNGPEQQEGPRKSR